MTTGAGCAPMNPDVAEAVAAWLPAWGLPPAPAAGVKDLKGTPIRVARFQDDDTVRFFFPRRTLSFQRRMVTAISRMLQKRGAKMETVALTVEDYARWCAAQGKSDTPEERFAFATRPPEI